MRTSALHPQSDSQVERQHQTILNYLAKFIDKNQKLESLDPNVFVGIYNRSSKHEATGVIPAELYFVQDLRLPVDLLQGTPPHPQRLGIQRTII